MRAHAYFTKREMKLNDNEEGMTLLNLCAPNKDNTPLGAFARVFLPKPESCVGLFLSVCARVCVCMYV